MVERHDDEGELFGVLAEGGKVAVSSPDGSIVMVSPEAAEEASDRLWKGAMCARQQQRQGIPD
jgi:hypothetical protein